jgi:transcriptional repressor NrdR
MAVVKCPFCGSEDSTVQETRAHKDGLRRRRTCATCKQRFTTYERLGSPGLRVVKRDGSREDFDADKLRKALTRVARRRPTVTDDDLHRIADEVEARLAARSKTVKWSDIVRTSLEILALIDPLAARRLAANYVDDTGALRLEDAPHPGDAPQLPLFDGDDEPA